ncbi:MAG: DMT family transporter [Chryseolinea sp.]
MNKIIWPVLAFLSGAFLPIQAAINAKLGKSIESPVYAALISFLVGTLALIAYIILTGQQVSFANAKSVPTYVWFGGILGAFYVTIIVFAFPRVGPALTFGLVVGGQMVISVLLDHFNILVATPHPINFWRIAGVGLIVAGVILVRKF